MITEIYLSEKKWKELILMSFTKRKELQEIYLDFADKQLEHFREHNYGFCYPKINIIGINLKVIQEDIKVRNMYENKDLDFYQYICETITHEEIHKWLEYNEGEYTSRGYDNIKNKLRMDGYCA